MTRKKYIYAMAWLLGVFFITTAQDRASLNSQYLFNGLIINPAYAGSDEALSVTLSHRRQWMGFEGAPNRFTLGIHTPFNREKIAFGLLAVSEEIGSRMNNSLYANYAYRISAGNGKLSLGLKGGVSSSRFMPIDLGNGDRFFDNSSENYLLPNFGLGIYYAGSRWFAGASIPLLLGYKNEGEGKGLTFYHEFNKYSYLLTAGYTYLLNSSWALKPTLLVNYHQSTLQPDGALQVLFKDMFMAGATFRPGESVVMLAGLQLGYQTSMALSYDFGIGTLSNYHHGSMEMTLKYMFGYKVRAANPEIF